MKIVRRSVAIALGIICIILVAGLGVVMAYYTMAINDKDNQISSINAQLAAITGNNTNMNATEIINQLNANITNLTNEKNQLQTWLAGNITAHNDYVATHSYTNDQYNAYVADHHHTDEEYANFYNIANLADSTVWVNDQTVSQPAGGLGVSYSSWTESASYAGYVSVWVQSSSVAGTHVRVIYSSNGVNFDKEIVVGAGDTASFPILPSSSMQVEVGNANLSGGATETVTITYYY